MTLLQLENLSAELIDFLIGELLIILRYDKKKFRFRDMNMISIIPRYHKTKDGSIRREVIRLQQFSTKLYFK